MIIAIEKDAAPGQDPQQREFVRLGIQRPQKFAELFGHEKPCEEVKALAQGTLAPSFLNLRKTREGGKYGY
jgi:hypothetical protein